MKVATLAFLMASTVALAVAGIAIWNPAGDFGCPPARNLAEALAFCANDSGECFDSNHTRVSCCDGHPLNYTESDPRPC